MSLKFKRMYVLFAKKTPIINDFDVYGNGGRSMQKRNS